METPNGGFRYPRNPDDPDFSEVKMIFGGDFQHLVKNVTEYRIINEMPLGDIEQIVQDWMCRNVPVECVPVRPRGFFAGVMARGSELARFMSAVTAWWKEDEVVPQEEAERRGEICASCRFNSPLTETGCDGCYGLAGRILQLLGNRKTRMENNLAFCAICSCSNRVQVFAPLKILNRAHKLSDFPTDIGDGTTPCWKKAAENEV